MSVSVKHGAWGWALGGCRSEVLAQGAHFSCPGPRHHRVQLFNAQNLGRGGTFTFHSTRRRRQRRRTRGGSHTYATLPATPSFFLPLPRSAKAAALHQGFEGHRSLQRLLSSPCAKPCKEFESSQHPVLDQGKCLENCTTMARLQSQKPPSQATVLVATSRCPFGVRTQTSEPPSTLLDERSDPVGWIKGTTVIANHSLYALVLPNAYSLHLSVICACQPRTPKSYRFDGPQDQPRHE
jgi:hypothetical protein